MEDKMFDKNEVRNSGMSHGRDLKKYEEKDLLEFINPDLIDNSKDLEKVNDFDVTTTPTVLVEKDEKSIKNLVKLVTLVTILVKIKLKIFSRSGIKMEVER